MVDEEHNANIPLVVADDVHSGLKGEKCVVEDSDNDEMMAATDLRRESQSPTVNTKRNTPLFGKDSCIHSH